MRKSIDALNSNNPSEAIRLLGQIPEHIDEKSWESSFTRSMAYKMKGNIDKSGEHYSKGVSKLMTSKSTNRDEKSYIFIYMTKYIDLPYDVVEVDGISDMISLNPNVNNVKGRLKRRYPMEF